MRNQKVLHNFIVPSCGYPPGCHVTEARMFEAYYYAANQKLPSVFLCFPQAKGLGAVCATYWYDNFYSKGSSTARHLNETWGTWDDTLRSVAEAEKFAREQGYGIVHHYLVSDPTQVWRMKLTCIFNGVENTKIVYVWKSGRPWRDIFPHEIFSYGKVFLKGSLTLLKRLWEALN